MSKQITRTIAGVKFVKQDEATTRQAGATSLWLTVDGRFELRGDDTIEFGADRSEIEWGVWDRQERGGEGDWADGGRGNGVESFKAGAAMIANVLAEEADRANQAKRDAAAPLAPVRPAALAHIGSVPEHQSKVLDKVNRLMRLASNAVTVDDELKMGTITEARVMLDELLAEFLDLGRADLIRSIESKGLHIPDNARA